MCVLDIVYIGGWRGRLSATVIVDEPILEDEDEEREEEEEKEEGGIGGAEVGGELWSHTHVSMFS